MSLTSYRAAPSRVTLFGVPRSCDLKVASLRAAGWPCGSCGAVWPAPRPLRGLGARLWSPRASKTPKGLPLRDSPVDYVNGFQHAPTSCNAWRRPTLPDLEAQYHRRGLVSRPSSRWDRVGHRRYGHQAMKLVDAGFKSMHTLNGVI